MADQNSERLQRRSDWWTVAVITRSDHHGDALLLLRRHTEPLFLTPFSVSPLSLSLSPSIFFSLSLSQLRYQKCLVARPPSHKACSSLPPGESVSRRVSTSVKRGVLSLIDTLKHKQKHILGKVLKVCLAVVQVSVLVHLPENRSQPAHHLSSTVGPGRVPCCPLSQKHTTGSWRSVRWA